MKASKAAQNWARMSSFSMSISWRDVGRTSADPVLSRAAKRSIAGVETTGSRPAAMIRVGTFTSSGADGVPRRAIRRKAVLIQAMVGSPMLRSRAVAESAALRA